MGGKGKKHEEWEAVVPDTWIQGTSVYWPSVVDTGKYINERKEPTKSWTKYPLMKSKFESGGDYTQLHNFKSCVWF